MPTVIKGQPSSAEVLERLAGEGKPVVLMFSCGKDSVAAWLAMREHGIEVVPVYLYVVPGLKFVEEELDYFSGFFGTRVHAYPHASFYRMLRGAVFQSPEHLRVLDAAKVPKVTYDQLWQMILEDLDLPQDTWKADGVRASDSLVRRASFVRHGVMKTGSRKVSPIADWLKGEVMDALEAAGVKLPIDYEIFGRSFDGIDYRFTKPMKEHLPEDYARLCEWFPMVPADIARWEAYGGL